MAMMMTGRVLLVCALCVLCCWCVPSACCGAVPAVVDVVVSGGGDNKKLEEQKLSSPVISGVKPQAPEVEESPTRRSDDVLEETYEVVVERDEADGRGVGADGEKGKTVQKGRGERESEGDSATEAELHLTEDEILRQPSPNGAKEGEKTIPSNDTPPEEKFQQKQEDPPSLLQSEPGDPASGRGVPPESTEHKPPASGNPSSETETTGIEKVSTPTHVRESPRVKEKEVFATKHEREDKEGSGGNPIKVTDVRLSEPQELRSQSLDGAQRVETGVRPINSLPEDQNKQRVLLDLSQGESANDPPETTPKSSSTGGHRVENSRANDDGAKNTEGSAAGEKKDDKKGLEKDVVPTISEGKLQPPLTTAASTSATAIDGDSKGSPTAATALQSDDGSESNPAKNGLRQPSSERIAQLSTTPDPEDASEVTENAAAEHAGIPTTKAIATAKTNDTVTTGDTAANQPLQGFVLVANRMRGRPSVSFQWI
ncbi:mucin-associated surface protein (MASP), putative [Trypanosoma cruzi]|uniref:Mucin-associated surface protein (MASP), putative n=1 Tax=Trypanosoma cruzi (strain CL Brener) TaxID=353153 RepID=Q4DUE2_TRYCC|nr:mucin-associated surface protein (MASP), putative [Trypanosoma cruzi]EAN96146.1 mucin-associated surface protein (MASP), putative [Trypanosoma cruzi]|eukprot:XP_817997.1 mucin-associated surface protein (MASP) [Trypanosoma cruzi strain CL Brener]